MDNWTVTFAEEPPVGAVAYTTSGCRRRRLVVAFWPHLSDAETIVRWTQHQTSIDA